MNVQTLVILALSASVYALNENLPPSCDVSARIESGMICGRIRNATDGTKYASFRGIRYGKAPRGELRFAPPQKPETWDGVYDASEVGTVCYQQVPVNNLSVAHPLRMDEDCLFINVHTPELDLPDPGSKPKRKLPVLAWVHGGYFAMGSGNANFFLGPEYLMADQDIIVVTFNYRLNVIGYLSLETDKVPGNTGLRDTIFALEWIQTNIENFGGDPADVTLGGESAGGATAHLLAISPATKGRNLFKKVICTSGTALANFYTYSPSYARSLRNSFLEAAGINPSESPNEIYKKLIEAPIEILMRASKSEDLFGPVIENRYDNIAAIIPEDPEVLMKEGYGNEYPMLLSFTNNECETLSIERAAFKKTESGPPPVFTVPKNLLHNAKESTIPILVEMMMAEYFNSTPLTLEAYLPSCTDGFFMYPAMRVARQRLATEAEDTFMYQFEYPGENSLLKIALKRSWTGAAHVEDKTYFFRFNVILQPSSVNELNQDDPDSKMRLVMTESIASFVKTGKPAPASLPRGNRWPATGQQLQFLNIEGPEEYNFMEPTPYMADKIDFFDKLYLLGREGKPAPASLPRGNRWPATGQQLQFLNIEGPEEYNFMEPTPYMADKIDFFDKLYLLGREGKPAPASLPRGNRWPATGQQLQFLNIEGPEEYNFMEPTPYMADKIDFFDKLYLLGREG